MKAAHPSGDPAIICPHCQSGGSVATRKVKNKRGISGGKATGAVLTGGLSLFAVGLSRKEKGIEARCNNCGVRWLI
jgi:DNA-directed RNA polymerase subunit RPC12/RpoP